MNKSELRRLVKIEDRINHIASEDLKLKFYPIEFDIVPPQKMLEILAYHVPTNISNWKYGRDYEKWRTTYEHGARGLPYEVVINSSPAKAYLMNDNKFSVHCLVMAHVFGHCAFFATNKYFINSRQDIVNIMFEASRRFLEYERRFGIDEVERIQDAGHALQWHSSPFETNETEQEKRLRIFDQKKKAIHSHGGNYSDVSGKTKKKINEDVELFNQKLWRALKLRTPVEPTEDVLRYLIDNSIVLEDWQKDILEVLRIEGRYYWPMMKTRYMNEGFACIVGDSLVHTENGFVPIEEAEEYCDHVVGINRKLTKIGDRYYTQRVPTVKIKTNTGLELEGAEYHRIQVANKNNEIEDVFLKDLKIGDTPLMAVGVGIWPVDEINIDIDKCLSHLKFSRSKDIKIPTKLNTDIAYFMGLFISEGCFIGRGIEITNTNLDLLKAAEEIIINNFDYKPSIIERSGITNKYDLKIYSTAIIDFFEQLGLKNNKSGDKEIPWSVLQSPKDVVSSFIAGYFDGDGCVYYNGRSSRNLIFTSKSNKLIKQLTVLLLNYGIVGSFRLNKKSGYENCYQLVVSRTKCLDIFNENISIKDNKKIELLKQCLENVKWAFDVPTTCKIIEITSSENINYDWHIPEGNHYIAQGFINHNTYVHQRIMNKLFDEGLLTSEEHADYNYSNSLVKSAHTFDLNPYLIGCGIWEDIEKRWNTGRHGVDWESCNDAKEKDNWDTNDMCGWEKCLEIMEMYTDWFFIQDFLTPELIRDLKIYIFEAKDAGTTIDYVITKDKAKQIKKKLVYAFAQQSIPKIEIIDGNYGNAGELIIKHKWDDVCLDEKYAKETMSHILQLWGRKVYLHTKDAEGGDIVWHVGHESSSDNQDEELPSDFMKIWLKGVSPLKQTYLLPF